MKVKVKKINDFTRALTVTVKWEDLKDDFSKEYSKAKKSYQIAGFRKGKVPDHIVEKDLGPGIEAKFAEDSINKYYMESLIKNELNPINKAEIKDLSFNKGDQLVFTAEFEIQPEVVLPKYNKINIQTTRYMGQKEDVKNALDDLRQKNANVRTIEGKIKSGYFIRGDFQQLDESGLPIINKITKDQYIRLGMKPFSGTSEKPFIGAKAGDTIRTSFDLNDKSVAYEIKINKVEEEALPDLDDEFAKTLDPKVSSLKEFKDNLNQKIQEQLDSDHKQQINNEIINYFVKNIKLKVPTSMKEKYTQFLMDDFKNKNPKQPVDENEFKKNYDQISENNIKWFLAKDRLINEMKISINDNDVEKKIKDFIKDNKDMQGDIKKFYSEDKNKKKLKEDLINEKLFNSLNEFVTNKVSEKSTDELRKKKSSDTDIRMGKGK